MPDVLTDFSPATLLAANQANLFAYLTYLGSSSAPKAGLHDGPDLKWSVTGLPIAFLNNVLRTQLSATNADARIAETLATLKSRQVNQLCWWVGADSQPPDLADRLMAHGLRYSPGGLGMAVDLEAIQDTALVPTSLTIETVRSEDHLRQWVNPGLAGFGVTGTETSDTCFALLAGLGFDVPLRLYVGYLDGKPVSVAQLFLGAGVAGIYWVATIPEARGKGIGTALTLLPLREARDMGYRIGILQASPMGEPVYRRLGFQEHGRLGNYVWADGAN